MSTQPPEKNNQNKNELFQQNQHNLPIDTPPLDKKISEENTIFKNLNTESKYQCSECLASTITDEIPPQSTPSPPLKDTLHTFQNVYSLFQFMILGIILLSLVSYWEAKQLHKIKWARGKIIWNEEIIKSLNEEILGKIEHRKVIVIPDVDIPKEEDKTTILSYIEKIELKDSNELPKLNFPAIIWFNNIDEFLPILESGRLPEPGKHEALAGDLIPSQNFFVEGLEYKVVGQIKKECAPFVGCYIIPFECLEKNPDNAAYGYAFPSFETSPAYNDIAKILSKQKFDTSTLNQISGIQARTSPLFVYGSVLGLIIICFSISGLLRIFYYRLANPPTPLLGPLFSNINDHKFLFASTNAIFYLIFFLFMFYGIYDPTTHREIVYYINHIFSEGELSYIGQAYAQKNILQAAITTFHNNFWVQTFLLTILISIPPLMLGVFKTLISFAFAGFAMAPIWCDTASKLTFHSITIGLELEAYIIAVFGVVMWTSYFWNGIITRKEILKKLKMGLKILIGATVASGTILAISAFYEAFTLIIFLI